MNEQTKRKMIRNYFRKFPTWAVVLIPIGLLALLIGLGTKGGGGCGFIGVIMAAAGGLGIYLYASAKPTDAQMDAWLEEELKKLTSRALQKTGTDESELVSEAVQVSGPRFWDIGGATVYAKKGADGRFRFSPVGVSVVNFTQHQLLGYTCVVDFTTGNVLNEGTEEYFYKDVVSVSTKTESTTVQIPKIGTVQMNSAEYFTLATAGTSQFRLFLRDPALINRFGGGEIPTQRAEIAIQAVRKMLRDKKST